MKILIGVGIISLQPESQIDKHLDYVQELLGAAEIEYSFISQITEDAKRLNITGFDEDKKVGLLAALRQFLKDNAYIVNCPNETNPTQSTVVETPSLQLNLPPTLPSTANVPDSKWRVTKLINASESRSKPPPEYRESKVFRF